MSDINLNTESLSDIVILSNTPSFLFERFKRDSSIQNLSDVLTAQELLKKSIEFGEKEEVNPDSRFLNRVKAYAYLVAIFFKNASEINTAIKNEKTPKFLWADEIINLITTNSFFCSEINMRYKKIAKILENQPTLSANTENKMHSGRRAEITTTPKIDIFDTVKEITFD